MIFELILVFLRDMVLSLLSVLPIPAVPAWARDASATISDVLEFARPLCGWVAFDVAVPVLAGVLAVWVATIALTVVRQVASAITPGGLPG